MEEKTASEGELSEEQLGEISGGCQSCSGDKGTIARAKERLAEARAALEHAQNTGNHALAQHYSQAYDHQAGIITQAQERIVGRGHEHLLRRPYVPDLNVPPAR